MPERVSDRLAAGTSRRGFLVARLGRGDGPGGRRRRSPALVAPGEAEAYHFCGHIYTTDSCPHPTGLPRIDRKGFPLRAQDGHPIDDLGRLIDADGRAGRRGRPPADRPRRPRRCRSPAARRVCDVVADRLRLRHPDRRRVVPLLRRPRPQARRLLLATAPGASTATPRSPATATRAARCSASCTTTRRSRARDRAHPRRGGGRRHRRVVAVRLLDGRDARAARLRRAAADHARRVRDVLAPARWPAASSTFGGLALLGQALGAGGPAALAVAAAIALAAAIGEARGARILPQVRRQVPESWRRRMPVPLAAGLYGVLLGLGFTTFILTFAVWALAGVSVAIGDPALGLRDRPRVRRRPAAAGRRARAGGGTERGRRGARRDGRAPAILRSLRAVDALAMAALRRRAGRPDGRDDRGQRDATRAPTARCSPGTSGGRAGVLVSDGQRAAASAARTRRSAAAGSRSSPTTRSRCGRRRASRSRPRSPPPGADARRRVGRSGSRGARARPTATRSSRPRWPAAQPRRVAESAELGRPALEGGRLAYHVPAAPAAGS